MADGLRTHRRRVRRPRPARPARPRARPDHRRDRPHRRGPARGRPGHAAAGTIGEPASTLARLAALTARFPRAARPPRLAPARPAAARRAPPRPLLVHVAAGPRSTPTTSRTMRAIRLIQTSSVTITDDRREQRVLVHAAGHDGRAEHAAPRRARCRRTPHPSSRSLRGGCWPASTVDDQRRTSRRRRRTRRGCRATVSTIVVVDRSSRARRAPTASRVVTAMVRIADSRTASAMPANPPSSRALPQHRRCRQASSSANIARTALRRADIAAIALSSRTTTAMTLASVSWVFSTRCVGLDARRAVARCRSGRAGPRRWRRAVCCAQLLVVAQDGHEDRVADGQRRRTPRTASRRRCPPVSTPPLRAPNRALARIGRVCLTQSQNALPRATRPGRSGGVSGRQRVRLRGPCAGGRARVVGGHALHPRSGCRPRHLRRPPSA